MVREGTDHNDNRSDSWKDRDDIYEPCIECGRDPEDCVCVDADFNLEEEESFFDEWEDSPDNEENTDAREPCRI